MERLHNGQDKDLLLQVELEKVNWEMIKTGFGGGKKLPVAIHGLLSEDEAIAAASEQEIWREIGQRGFVYESTYKVATILVRMLPLYNHLPAVQARLRVFSFEILSLFYIGKNDALFTELIKSFEPALPLLMEWAVDQHWETARMAQFILIRTGKTEAIEKLLMQEWENTTHFSARRGYAIFSLCAFYTKNKQIDKLVDIFGNAFVKETNVFLRFAMAAHLLMATGEEALDSWPTELLLVSADPKTIDNDFRSMIPWAGNGDIVEYIMFLLERANPAKLETIKSRLHEKS